MVSPKQLVDAEQGERLLSSGPDTGEDDAYKAQPPPPRRGTLLVVLAVTMLLGLLGVLSLALPGSAGVIRAHDPLNPYDDSRQLQAHDGRFKVVLFSDLHYGERGANNSWVPWADEAVSVQSIVIRR